MKHLVYIYAVYITNNIRASRPIQFQWKEDKKRKKIKIINIIKWVKTIYATIQLTSATNFTLLYVTYILRNCILNYDTVFRGYMYMCVCMEDFLPFVLSHTIQNSGNLWLAVKQIFHSPSLVSYNFYLISLWLFFFLSSYFSVQCKCHEL